MTEETLRMARADQAEAALAQYLRPAFNVAHADYLQKLAEIAAKPLTNDIRAAMEKLALGLKVLKEVRGQVEALVIDGEVARADVKRADHLAGLTTEQKWWASW